MQVFPKYFAQWEWSPEHWSFNAFKTRVVFSQLPAYFWPASCSSLLCCFLSAIYFKYIYIYFIIIIFFSRQADRRTTSSESSAEDSSTNSVLQSGTAGNKVCISQNTKWHVTLENVRGLLWERCLWRLPYETSPSYFPRPSICSKGKGQLATKTTLIMFQGADGNIENNQPGINLK